MKKKKQSSEFSEAESANNAPSYNLSVLKKAGGEPDIHIITTEPGIEKRGAEDPFFSEIDAVNRELKQRLKKF
ncbi:putative zinc-binding protein [Methanomicrobium antiquum]|uniref:Zinc-binding protein n=1 Tax=Methanomicrobium antiquum TaxID=487686 RepID=A0AAF0JTS5_9EURY|nr:hypothetical protein [Methanomicrobium antiquum]WFN36703.1 putative zinc-binding protein [Methanomicrobium antiquum]